MVYIAKASFLLQKYINQERLVGTYGKRHFERLQIFERKNMHTQQDEEPQPPFSYWWHSKNASPFPYFTHCTWLGQGNMDKRQSLYHLSMTTCAHPSRNIAFHAIPSTSPVQLDMHVCITLPSIFSPFRMAARLRRTPIPWGHILASVSH